MSLELTPNPQVLIPKTITLKRKTERFHQHSTRRGTPLSTPNALWCVSERERERERENERGREGREEGGREREREKERVCVCSVCARELAP